MADRKSPALLALQRIASVLGTNVSALYGKGTFEPQRAEEVLDLLHVFETIDDADDRRACLELVRSVATRRQTS